MQPNSILAQSRPIAFDGNPIPLSSSCEGKSPCPVSQYQSSATSIDKEAENLVDSARQKITQALAQPDTKTLAKLAKVNQKRRLKGLVAIDLNQTAQDLEKIQSDSSLSPQEKKKRVEALRKQLGLSKGEMKALFIKRLSSLYKAAEKNLSAFERAKQEQIQSELRQTESLYGNDSPQAKAVQSKLEALHQRLDPEKQKLQESSRFYHSLYSGFWAKLGGFFKKIGRGLSKLLDGLGFVLRLLPGLGPLAARVLTSVKYLFQGKILTYFKNLGQGIVESVKNWKDFLPLIPGIGPIASLAVTGIGAVLKATRGGTRQL